MSEIDLYWITNSVTDMSLIVEQVFPELWGNNLSCKTILFEDTMKDKDTYEAKLRNLLIAFCQNVDEAEWLDIGSTYAVKKNLLPTSSVAFVSEMERNFKHLKNCWMDKTKLQTLKENPNKVLMGIDTTVSEDDMSVVDLIKGMNIPKGTAIVLDICLLDHDDTRIKDDSPLISMALYHLLKAEHVCYLYSGRYATQTLIDSWIKTYHQVFDNEDKVRIYPQKDLTTEQTITEAKKNLISLFHREMAV